MSSEKLDQKFWLKYFKVYDVLNSLIPYRETLNEIVSEITGNDLVILDVGCGTGNLMASILKKKKIKNIFGVDYSDAALNIAKEKSIFNKFIFQKVDIANSSLPFKDNYFDYVVMNNVLYTIKDNKRLNVIKEIYRVLKPGGRFVTSNINDNFKPLLIYTTHIKKSISIKGVWNTFLEVVKFIKPTILIFYYNYLIKKENNIGEYSFIKFNEQGALLADVGFYDIKDNVKTYSGNAYLTLGTK